VTSPSTTIGRADHPRRTKRPKQILPTDARVAYETESGQLVQGLAEIALRTAPLEQFKGQVQLLFTSPPYPLRTKKKYGNETGQAYVDWLAGLAPLFCEYLAPTGSIVIELGNAWEPGEPVMSVLGLQALLRFLEIGRLKLCEQFVCENPARLPGPAQWVNVERIRVKDAFTHVWWMSSTARPKADNRRVLKEYSKAMKDLLRRQTYNAGGRPSEHQVNAESFLVEHAGAIPSNVLSFANTNSQDSYFRFCRAHDIKPHPARMPSQLAEFFIKLLTDEGEIVLDPFAGSNTTGATAHRLGRRWLSVEPRSDYIRGSVGRFERAPALAELFETEASVPAAGAGGSV
jgi:DNA modification methylase